MALSLSCLDINHVASCPLQSCPDGPLSRTSSFRAWHPHSDSVTSTSCSSNQQNTFGSKMPCNVAAVRASIRRQGGSPSLAFRSNYHQSRTSPPLKCSVSSLFNNGRLGRKKKHVLTRGGPSIRTAAGGLANKTLVGGSLSPAAGSVFESEGGVCLHRFPSSSVSLASSSWSSSSSASSSSVHGRGTGDSGACPAPVSSSALIGRRRWRQADSRVVVTCVAPHNDAAIQTEVKDVPGAESANGAPSRAVIVKGSTVRVKGSLVVYHVPKQPAFDLIGREGKMVDVVDTWKGKHISANFPYKVAFEMEAVGGGKPTKFFAHFVEEEIELVS